MGRLGYAGLEGRVVVITGAGQGLGSAYAHHFGRAGSRVAVVELDQAKGARVAREVADAGGQALAVATDVTDPASCAAAVERVVSEWGRLDVLINNASNLQSIRMKPFWELAPEEWDAMMAVNLRGTWAMARAAVEALRADGGGSVINVASGVVFLGRPLYAHYVASKAGVIGLTRAMARELGEHGVRVNTLSAGPIETGIPRDTVDDDQFAGLVASQCVKRRGRPEDLLGAIAFLASDDSEFISGQILNVDGGLALH
jgi:3-oxoacyl-[acyl-carrier protein] reductase